MNLLRKVCKELGVEINKEWLGSDGFYYCIDESGQIEVSNKDGELLNYGYVYWEDIFTGFLKPAWEPEHGEYYFVPRPDFKSGWNENCWVEDAVDYHRLSNNLIFKTKEEAIEVANKMRKAAKGR